jgi:hypothetical protein
VSLNALIGEDVTMKAACNAIAGILEVYGLALQHSMSAIAQTKHTSGRHRSYSKTIGSEPD